MFVRMLEVNVGDGGKALLIRQDGKFTAIGNKCTHYGAPLAKGLVNYTNHFMSNDYIIVYTCKYLYIYIYIYIGPAILSIPLYTCVSPY